MLHRASAAVQAKDAIHKRVAGVAFSQELPVSHSDIKLHLRQRVASEARGTGAAFRARVCKLDGDSSVANRTTIATIQMKAVQVLHSDESRELQSMRVTGVAFTQELQLTRQWQWYCK